MIDGVHHRQLHVRDRAGAADVVLLTRGGQLQDFSKLRIYFLDSCEDPGRREDDYPNLKRLEERWMVTLGSLATLDPVAGMNKRDDAKAGARNWGT